MIIKLESGKNLERQEAEKGASIIITNSFLFNPFKCDAYARAYNVPRGMEEKRQFRCLVCRLLVHFVVSSSYIPAIDQTNSLLCQSIKKRIISDGSALSISHSMATSYEQRDGEKILT